MHFWKHFKPRSCSIGLKSRAKDEALAEVARNLVAGGSLPEAREAEAVLALVERERLGSTGVGMGVAIPHVKLAGLERAACSLSVHATGLEWQSIDGSEVQLLFTVLRPERASATHDPDRHLEMMRWIARLARDGDFRRFALRARTKTELVDLLKEMSAV